MSKRGTYIGGSTLVYVPQRLAERKAHWQRKLKRMQKKFDDDLGATIRKREDIARSNERK